MSTMSAPTVQSAADHRHFPKFDLVRLLSSVFEPTQGKRICILIDLPDLALAKDFAFLDDLKLQIQARAHKHFYTGLKEGGLAALGATGGEMFAYPMTGGSNLDMDDLCVDMQGNTLSLEKDVYSKYDIIDPSRSAPSDCSGRAPAHRCCGTGCPGKRWAGSRCSTTWSLHRRAGR